MKVQQDIPLAPLTTLGVGGLARYFIEATTLDDVKRAAAFAVTRARDLFVLGGGSNLLVADRGYRGMVMKMSLRGIREKGIAPDGRRIFSVAAGEPWDSFVAHVIAQNCAGIECLSGIPGTVGGTPIQNVGAYGQEVSETIHAVRVLDLESMEVVTLSPAECGFAYRSSIFNTSMRGRYIVLVVEYALTPGGAPRIEYADLKRWLAEHAPASGTPTLAETRDAVRAIRHGKAMLIVEGDEDCRSAGSFFKNPIVSETDFARITEAATRMAKQQPPKYPAQTDATADLQFKTSAAWLVENAGFTKGTVRGNVGISRKHALALVNRGGASASEFVEFKKEIQKKVFAEFGVSLHPEPVFLGF